MPGIEALIEPFRAVLVGNHEDSSQRRVSSPTSPAFLEEGWTDKIREINLRPPRWMLPTVLLERFIWRLIPWCVSSSLGKSARRLPKVTSTSYMNGIRGLACVIVYQYHITTEYFPAMMHPYGAEPLEANNSITQLPIFRIMYAGESMVCLFFVLSGFVLSYSPLRKINSLSSPSASNDLVSGLCSSVLRRFLRLFGPEAVLALITAFVSWNNPAYPPGGWRDSDPTFMEHLDSFRKDLVYILNPFSQAYDLRPRGLEHCWTLVFEYRGSMVTYLFCIMTAKLTSIARKFVLCVACMCSLYGGRWEMFCFIAGMILAELRYSPLSRDLPTLHPSLTILLRAIRPLAFLTLFVVSLLLLSWPPFGDRGIEPFATMVRHTPAWWTTHQVNPGYFYGSIGSVGLILSLENLPSLQRPLTSEPVLYLGEISFSFYLLHWIIYRSVGKSLYNYLTTTMTLSPDNSYFVMYAFCIIAIIAASDIYWRAVDENCVSLSRIMANFLWAREESIASPVCTEKDPTGIDTQIEKLE
ncbi:acyltransferase family-domain-containing protein [Xylariales sp. PMI_506]|nr:acyltransferase family-domain-containing protein [Xylariales sp. PMI_506]